MQNDFLWHGSVLCCISTIRLFFIVFILQKMSIPAVSDSLFLSSFCSFQERGQRLWWGKRENKWILGSCWHHWPNFRATCTVLDAVFFTQIIHQGLAGQMLSGLHCSWFFIYFFGCCCSSVHMVCNIFMCGASWFSVSSQRRPSGSVPITRLFWPAKWDSMQMHQPHSLCTSTPRAPHLFHSYPHYRPHTSCSLGL